MVSQNMSLAMAESNSKEKRFPVVELFGPTIQGEGLLCGQRSHFLRLGGCPYRCNWCDSLHAVLPELIKKNAIRLTTDEIITGIQGLEPSPWITLSGGDPVMHDLRDLVYELKRDYKIAVETEGALYSSWVEQCNLITVSPKPPSSGMSGKLDHEILNRYYKLLEHDKFVKVVFKVVIFGEDDLEFAISKHELFPRVPFYLSVGTPVNTKGTTAVRRLILNQMEWLFNRVLKEPSLADVTVLPQLHCLAWGHQKGK